MVLVVFLAQAQVKPKAPDKPTISKETPKDSVAISIDANQLEAIVAIMINSHTLIGASSLPASVPFKDASKISEELKAAILFLRSKLPIKEQPPTAKK